MDEVGAIQVGHPLTHIQTHPQQDLLGETAFPGTQKVCQAAVLHEFKHQVDGRALSDHTMQLDQLIVGQFPVEADNEQCNKFIPYRKNT